MPVYRRIHLLFLLCWPQRSLYCDQRQRVLHGDLPSQPLSDCLRQDYLVSPELFGRSWSAKQAGHPSRRGTSDQFDRDATADRGRRTLGDWTE